MRTIWMTAAAAGLLAQTAVAQESAPAPAPDEAAEVEQVVVTATRTEKTEVTAPATVSVVTAREIEDNLVTDIKDLVRFEPGVSVRSSPARFGATFGSTGREGNAGFNIRGLEGNRVLIQVDGIRVPEGFSFGPQAVGRGDYADLGLIKSVEILRGPASALYGSDGVAGVVSFVTKDPVDFLEPGRAFGARGQLAYASADDSRAASLVAAGRAGRWSGLLAYTRRDAHEQETQGENETADARRTAANPQDIASNAVLGKLVFAPSEAHRLRLTYDRFDREVATEVLSGRSVPPLTPAGVIDLDALDEIARDRLAFDYRYDGAGAIERAWFAVYAQDSRTVEFSAEDRNTAADRTRRSTFDNSVVGVSAQAESALLGLGGVRHRLVFGGDASWTRQEGLREGTVPPVGERFPTRAFPNTDYRLSGLFLQDEIALLDGRLTLYPALRYDEYALEPEADPLFPAQAVGSSGSRLSPKVSALFFPVPAFGLFFNYAEGFKAPSPFEVNNGFANVVFNYLSLPNPDLKPETSRTVEAGVRVRDVRFLGGRWSGSATAFSGEYEDFIEQVLVRGRFTRADPGVFQFVNLAEVEISGLEARAESRWDNGLGFIAAASSARGDRTRDGGEAPLDSIDPLKLVAGLTYREPAGRYGGQLILTRSAGKEDDRTGGACSPACYTPAGFTILDATAFWKLTGSATLRAGLFNITDETYSWWSDVRGLPADTPVAEAYTQPGRNVSLSLTLEL